MGGAMPPLWELLACPECACALRDLSCPACGRQYYAPNGIPRLCAATTDERTAAVRQFYAECPFPGYAEGETLSTLRARAGRSSFIQLLDRSIAPDARILEMGCGTGQASLFLASAERLVIGADLSRPSLELGARAARNFGANRILFVETDLQRPGLRAGSFDVVYSSGVLHHTADPRRSFKALARLLRPGGLMVLAVYNALARLPHRVRRALARTLGLNPSVLDPVLRERSTQQSRRVAWFRDQYQHPEEHCHTLREVKSWFEENGIQYFRSYPAATLADSGAEDLLAPVEEPWSLEEWLAQATWMAKLAREGGLFAVVGRMQKSFSAERTR
jgi:SAM-dependent methyltransferase